MEHTLRTEGAVDNQKAPETNYTKKKLWIGLKVLENHLEYIRGNLPRYRD